MPRLPKYAPHYGVDAPRYKDVRIAVRDALMCYIGCEFEIFGDAREIAPGLKRRYAVLKGVYPHIASFEVAVGPHGETVRIGPSLATVALFFKPNGATRKQWDFFNTALLEGWSKEDE